MARCHLIFITCSMQHLLLVAVRHEQHAQEDAYNCTENHLKSRG